MMMRMIRIRMRILVRFLPFFSLILLLDSSLSLVSSFGPIHHPYIGSVVVVPQQRDFGDDQGQQRRRPRPRIIQQPSTATPAFHPKRPKTRTTTTTTSLWDNEDSDSSPGGGNEQQQQQQQQQQRRVSLTAAEQERRAEAKRRQERRADVVLGKTSAVPGAQDYRLDISATEQEWLRQASTVEQEVYRQTEQGMNHFKLLELRPAAACFDRVFAVKPQAYLWQAGIVQYYLQDYETAAQILVNSAQYYENRFGEPATEERIWRNACELKLATSLHRRERKRLEQQQPGGIAALVPQIPKRTTFDDNDISSNNHDHNPEQAFLRTERRKVLRLARELFDASLAQEHDQVILARARLRAICGDTGLVAGVGVGGDQSPPKKLFQLDQKMWKLNAWFYLGLHADVTTMGNNNHNVAQSKKCMKMALRMARAGAADLVHTLPMLHMAQREWFDDDPDMDADLFGTNENNKNNKNNNNDNNKKENPKASAEPQNSPTLEATTTTTTNTVPPAASTTTTAAATSTTTTPEHEKRIQTTDPILVASLREGIDELIVDELRETLQKRNISAVGSKRELQDKLLDSLLRDVVAAESSILW